MIKASRLCLLLTAALVHRGAVTMAWRSHGKDNNDLLQQLKRELLSQQLIEHELLNLITGNGIIKSDHVYKAMAAVDRQNYCPNSPYMDSPQSIGKYLQT